MIVELITKTEDQFTSPNIVVKVDTVMFGYAVLQFLCIDGSQLPVAILLAWISG